MGKKQDDDELYYVDFRRQVQMLGYTYGIQRCLQRERRRRRILRRLRTIALLAAFASLVYWMYTRSSASLPHVPLSEERGPGLK